MKTIYFEDLPMSERIDVNEIDFYISQATRWIDGTFDKFLGNETRESKALFEIKMALRHIKYLKNYTTKLINGDVTNE